MHKNFLILRKKFNNIKQMGLIKADRKGTTGIGYTFESLLGKIEDAQSTPDFYNIELKTKLGYSKSPITLFTCIPKRNNESAINYIVSNYGWERFGIEPYLVYSNELYHNNFTSRNGYTFNLDVDYLHKKIIMKSYKYNSFIENVCYWSFDDLEKKLKIKLSYLAVIHGYPYKRKNELYYKYFKMNTYKLKEFLDFLLLIEQDKIKILMYIKKSNNDKFENHGVAFRIDSENLEHLFTKLHY